MPDEQGKLSPDELQKALKWIESKLTVKTCPMCGDEKLILDDSLAALPVMGDKQMVRETLIPAFVLTCGNCGYIRLFNAMRAEIIARQSPPA